MLEEMSADSGEFREYSISPVLAPFLESIWSMEAARAHQVPRERILPDGCVELVMHFQDPFRNHFFDNTTNLQPKSFVVGQMKHFLEIEPVGATGFIAVRFRAHGAYLFFKTPLTDITDSVVPLREVWNDRANECTERLALARGMAERVQIVEHMLLEALHANGRRDHAVERCVHLIQNATEPLMVTKLASMVGLSSRQLARRFQTAVGMTVKEFARVNRFIRAARRLRMQDDSSLTETAYACAYFDQAHFNHEFREFAGITPREFVAAMAVAI